jgi:hypothetical protein
LEPDNVIVVVPETVAVTGATEEMVGAGMIPMLTEVEMDVTP